MGFLWGFGGSCQIGAPPSPLSCARSWLRGVPGAASVGTGWARAEASSAGNRPSRPALSLLEGAGGKSKGERRRSGARTEGERGAGGGPGFFGEGGGRLCPGRNPGAGGQLRRAALPGRAASSPAANPTPPPPPPVEVPAPLPRDRVLTASLARSLQPAGAASPTGCARLL